MALSDLIAPFQWGAGGARLSPEDIAKQRQVEDALLAKGIDTSPVGHWTQGLARVADALAGSIRRGQLDTAAKDDADFNSQIASSLLGGGSDVFPAAPSVSGATGDVSSPMAVSDVPTQRVSQAFGDGQQSFVDGVMPAALEASKATGIDPRIIVAQAALESGYGQHAPGNNLFGIKGGNGPELATKEVVNGQPVNTTAQFRQYASPADSVQGYADFINSNPRYGDLKAAQGLDAQLQALGASGYATDPAYAAKVGSIARGITVPQAATDAVSALADGQTPAPPLPAPIDVPDRPVQVAQAANPNQMSDATALSLLGAKPYQAGDINPAIVQALSDPRASDMTRQIATMLVKQKLDPNAALDTEIKRAQLEKLQRPETTSDITNFDYAKKNGFTGSFTDFKNANTKTSYGQTPIILTDPQGDMHMGQMSSGGGVLIDGKTYQSLPSGWKAGTVSQSGSGGLSDEALDIISSQYLAGDKTAIQGFARNATARTQLANAIAAKADSMGMDGKAIAAEVSAYGGNVAAQRAAGTRAAQVGMAASEANQMADIALDASRAVPRGSLMAWNGLQNAVRTGTSSPEMAAFVTATTSLVNAYARAISPLGAPTDAMRKHAEDMLNTAQSPQAYEAVIDQMKREMVAALNAPSHISEGLKKQITGSDAKPAVQPEANPASSVPTGSSPAPVRAVNPQTGETIELQNGKWVPVQ
ncbi:MAG: glycoside hydrolase family 73 protein [Rhizobiaceae bacterium]